MLETLFYSICAIVGIPFGLLLQSGFERKLFPGRMPWLPFGSISTLGLLCGIILKTLLVLPLFFLPVLLLFKLGRHLQVCNGQVIYLFYLIGILIGKGLRFLYWYRKREWA